jgi:hypothetical protein
MKRSLILLLFVGLCHFSWSNSAQPGLWSAGGGGGFTLLFPEDSSSFQKIQMLKEIVSIQLYKGFAVVKGQYWMQNDEQDTIRMTAGYPINSFMDKAQGTKRSEIYFDELYQMKVSMNSESVPLLKDKGENEWNNDAENWYLWEACFNPDTVTLIEVYFIVNTNDATVRKGYSKSQLNGFIYLLESGASWKPPIGNGKILIQLMDNMGLDDIHGAIPDSAFRYDEKSKILKMEFQDLIPTAEDNIVITYNEKNPNFDFSAVLAQKDNFYGTIDELSTRELTEKDFIPMKFNDPYEIASDFGWGGNSNFWVITLPILLVALFGVLLIRRVKR